MVEIGAVLAGLIIGGIVLGSKYGFSYENAVEREIRQQLGEDEE